jgi:hypothetical protein
MLTIDALMGIVDDDQQGVWQVQAGSETKCALTLRDSLQKAYDLSLKGYTSRILLPNNKGVVESGQIYLLWCHAGIIDEPCPELLGKSN